MALRFLLKVATFSFAFIILFVSMIETSSIKYAFGAKNSEGPLASPKVSIAYSLPKPSRIMPGDILWPAKALQEKINMGFKHDKIMRGHYELGLADMRLAAGWELWKEGETNEALITFEKAEGYLSQAYEDMKDDSSEKTLTHLATASLKHREILETVLSECSDDARPTVTTTLNTSKILYQKISAQMEGLQFTPPANPF